MFVASVLPTGDSVVQKELNSAQAVGSHAAWKVEGENQRSQREPGHGEQAMAGDAPLPLCGTNHELRTAFGHLMTGDIR